MVSPPASSELVRRIMQSNRSTSTRPELALQAPLDQAGIRYEANAVVAYDDRGRTITPDMALRFYRVVVFVDGCFWHGCPDHHRPSIVNHAYWADKVRRNRSRDRRQTALLRSFGWSVVRVWEHTPTQQAVRVVRSVVTRRLHKEMS